METRKKQSISALNKKPVSNDTKLKLSKVSLGKNRTKETKEKMRIASLKREKEKNGKKFKKVICLNTGDVFNSLMDAARWCGLAGCSGISICCKSDDKRKTSGIHPITNEKLRWSYVLEED